MGKRCVCCDLPVESCGRAIEAKQREDAAAERRALTDRGWFAASWPGTCVECGTWFGHGTLIHEIVNTGLLGQRQWVAECCASVVVS